ncbi:hypothetical protein RHGRI_008198 [Rhododendron griersonianum]|uniref:Uncharacterized protein n=1 Tax=Rhododendron griersonianum TaxID=479676 RepID=A0AAV6L1H6_9ERIC|nr:hypothetical protein RHGRI_008198 [Rhododendron griersonianum]
MVRESFLQPTHGGYQGSELAADSFIRPLSRKGIRWELLLSAALYPLLLLIHDMFHVIVVLEDITNLLSLFSLPCYKTWLLW